MEIEYGCPVECKYCVITKIESRKDMWEKDSLLGINKAVTILNPPRDLDNKEELSRYYNFPLDLLKGDFVSFNAISDPFWPKYKNELGYFLDNVSKVAKLVTCVTKFNPNDETLKKLSEIDNFRLVVSITGLDQIENTKTRDRLDLLSRAKKYGVKAFPLIHPYISGVSNLSFLTELKSLGYENVDIKGLRYNPVTMDSWMSQKTQRIYRDMGELETLPDDGWKSLIYKAGLTKLSLKDWYKQSSPPEPKLSYDEATYAVRELWKKANIVSSDTDNAVFEAAVKRRM